MIRSYERFVGYHESVVAIITDPSAFSGHEIHIEVTRSGNGFFNFYSAAELSSIECCAIIDVPRARRALGTYGCIIQQDTLLYIFTVDGRLTLHKIPDDPRWGPCHFVGNVKCKLLGPVHVYI